MKISIMQPYFFPYVGYYHLIAKTDKFIFLDNVQYIRHGWINRNRILHPVKQNGFKYINVPIKINNESICCQIGTPNGIRISITTGDVKGTKENIVATVP